MTCKLILGGPLNRGPLKIPTKCESPSSQNSLSPTRGLRWRGLGGGGGPGFGASPLGHGRRRCLYMYVSVCVCIYIYIYIDRERDIDRYRYRYRYRYRHIYIYIYIWKRHIYIYIYIYMYEGPGSVNRSESVFGVDISRIEMRGQRPVWASLEDRSDVAYRYDSLLCYAQSTY